MSNQIVITSGAKVRNLSGVLTASSGVVDSVGFGTANGVATLDSNGKVPLSQLPASVVTYLGTWNAATNTPTLANGTGDVGDLYICNVAGTVNFGAGPITFAVGDWVIYNGSQWQKSAGASGTVTSVAMTVPTGLSVTGSPITTSGTLAVSLSSGYTIPTTSFLAGLVPYTGATTDVDLGTHVLNAQSLHVKGTAGAGHLGLKHQSTAATGSANESLIYANVDGDLAWQNDNLYLTTLSTHANTANRVYTFPNASGTIALTSDISYPVTSVFGRTGAVTAQSGDYTTTQVTEGTNLYYTDARARGAISLTTTGTSGAATYNSTTGVLNVPNYTPDLSNYVTLNTSQTITGSKTFNAYILSSAGGGNQATVVANISTLHSGSSGVNGFGFNVNNNIYFGKGLDNGGVFSWNNTTVRYYTLPDATGTIALTSDIPSLTNYVTLSTIQTISGQKTFSNNILIDGGGAGRCINIKQYSSTDSGLTGYTSIFALSSSTFGISFGNGNVINLKKTTGGTGRDYSFPDADGTIALTSDIPSLSGYVQGSGTTNYLSKFTASGTIGNSLVYDNGTTVAIGSTAYSGGAKLITYQTSSNTAECGIISYTTAGAMAYLADVTTGDIFRGDSTIASVKSTKFRVTNAGAATFASSVTTNGDLTVSATQPNSYLTYTDATSYARMLFYESATYKGVIQFMGSSFVTTSRRNALEIINGTTGDIAMGSGDTRTFYIKNGGNVGINTSSPSQVLDIVGTFRTRRPADTTQYIDVYSSGGEGFIDAVNSAAGTSQALIFRNGNSGGTTERMRITSSGNVGIGTSSPLQTNTNRTVTTINGTNDAILNLATGGTLRGYIYVDSSSYTELYSVGQLAFLANASQPMTFATNGSERMRITSGGEVCVNRTSGSGKFNIDGTFYMYNMSTGAGNSTLKYNTSTGLVTNDSSARIFKKDIIDLEYGLESILKMSPKKYKWKSDDSNDLGFIADEMYEIIPEIVSLANNSINKTELQDGEPMGINYDRLVPVLVKAIQELKAEIDELKNK